MAFDIEAAIDGKRVSRAGVLAWENRRITASAKVLGIPVAPDADVASRREELMQAKLSIGAEGLLDRFAAQLRIADWSAQLGSRITTRRAFVTADLHVAGGSAGQLVQWFDEQLNLNNQAAMLRACPDHYVLRTDSGGRQQVVQAIGASPMLNQFFLDYGSEEGLANPREPQYPHQIVASARLVDGTLIGGARMQFRDTRTGFFARLIEEFPLLTPGFMIKQQRWHTTLEFSNWAEAAHAQ
ncbi:hypothetical protein ACTJJE_10505 [Mycolicibacterium sp. 22603]|uniref:hypothetical protein n=1 Tax=Mycolicibacterium sp. 22603 TaxID=3453950 RepID=UPI003F836969